MADDRQITRSGVINDEDQLSVSVVIPSFNGHKLLNKNLSSVLLALRERDELIIIDDASTDKTLECLIKKFNLNLLDKQFSDFEIYKGKYKKHNSQIQIQVIVNNINLRFAASVNRAVKLAQNPIIFLINNDVLPNKDVIGQVMFYFKKPDTFAVGCLESETIDENSKKKTVKGGKNKLWFERGMFIHSRADQFTSGLTAWASGGSAFFSKEKWLKLRGFDLIYYPAYWEDIDLSFRAKKHGWKVYFEEKAVVKHNHESTHSVVFGIKKMECISWKNAIKFTLKNSNFWQKIAFFIWRPYWWWKRSVGQSCCHLI